MEMEDNLKTKYALITGSSSGIGKCFAYECAKRNINLILVALPDTGLEEVRADIELRFKIRVLTYETDLTQPCAALQLYDWCIRNQLQLMMLVNNAGIGYEGEFEKLNPGFCEKLMQLNTQTIVMLTRLFVPELRKVEQAYILNVSSMAGFSPMPYKSLYAASKSFVYSFTRALREELRNTSVSVSVLCPGPVLTNPAVKIATANHGAAIKLIVKKPEQVAAIALRKMLHGKAMIVPGAATKIYLAMMKTFPDSIQQFLIGWQFRKTLAAYPAR
jgi:uncharacterized protein